MNLANESLPGHKSAQRRRGAIVLLFAIMLIVVMALVALSVDLGYVCSVKTDLQTAVDAGALAGAGVLLDGKKEAERAAEKFVRLNLNNQGTRTQADQQVTVHLGRWDYDARQFLPGRKPLDAVKVSARVENVSLFFGRAIAKRTFGSEASAVASSQPRDIMLVLDVSGSMNESRNGVRKIDELRGAVRYFLSFLRKARSNDRVGFSYYSTDASLGAELDLDLGKVEGAILARLRPDGWTNIADGMRLAIEELTDHRREQAAPLIVLLTDGAANMNQPGDYFDPTEAKRRVIEHAEAARRQKIPIFTMSLDSLTTSVDVALMKSVAEITGSESFHILAGEHEMDGNTQLWEAFRRVALSRPLRLVE